jgi:LuxR family quorum sensing-dependent transcriptional regulator
MPRLEETALSQFHARLNSENSISGCSREFLKALKPFGIITFACGEIDTAAEQRTVFFAIEWPEKWRNFYLQSGLMQRDPVISCLPHYNRPFTWAELARDRLLLKVGLEALERVREHGWSDGVIVPIPRGGTRYGLVSLVAEAPTIIDETDKSLIALLAVSFHERARTLAPQQGFPVPPAGLTDREIACLSLIARGYTDREVGQQLGIAQSTAHEHFENAKRKLDASGRSEAVALGVSLGIIAL